MNIGGLGSLLIHNHCRYYCYHQQQHYQQHKVNQCWGHQSIFSGVLVSDGILNILSRLINEYGELKTVELGYWAESLFGESG